MTPGGDIGLRVLHVEDEPANRALVRTIIARADPADLGPVALAEAGTLAEARAVLAAEMVDVVLVDVRLPDGSGLDLAAEIRDRLGTSRPQVIVVSASVLPVERSSALTSGADGFLGKPFSPNDLVDLLKQLAVNTASHRRPPRGAATAHPPRVTPGDSQSDEPTP
jgi:CheY-like chemotaxis protein